MLHRHQDFYDLDGIHRVAQVMLRHVRPETRNEAYDVLEHRLGVYMADRNSLRVVIDSYFDERAKDVYSEAVYIGRC